MFSREILAVKENDIWSMYIPEDEYTRLSQKGRVIFNDKECIDEYINECRLVMDSYANLCRNIKNIKGNFDLCYRNVVLNYYKLYSLIMAQYRITNIECTSLLQESRYVECLTKMRWEIRQCFMGGNEIFYQFLRKSSELDNYDDIIPYLTLNDILECRENFGAVRIPCIKEVRCNESGVELVSLGEVNGDSVSLPEAKVKSVKGINVSRCAKVNGKVLVLKSGNLTNAEKQLLKNGKYIVVTVSLHFNIAPYKDNIIGLACDEGGVLSHAGIIAREYNLPCITGTKIGTKVFETGDTVVLDTSHQILKICNMDNNL